MINFEGKRCNDNISDLVTEKDITKIERKVGKRFQKVFKQFSKRQKSAKTCLKTC